MSIDLFGVELFGLDDYDILIERRVCLGESVFFFDGILSSIVLLVIELFVFVFFDCFIIFLVGIVLLVFWGFVEVL